MAEKKSDLSIVSYTMGILSIVFAVFNPIAGFVFAIIGITQSKKSGSDLAKKAKKLSTIGLVLSIIMFAISVAITAYLTANAGTPFTNFPVA